MHFLPRAAIRLGKVGHVVGKPALFERICIGGTGVSENDC